jgi:hypothetical protein
MVKTLNQCFAWRHGARSDPRVIDFEDETVKEYFSLTVKSIIIDGTNT